MLVVLMPSLCHFVSEKIKPLACVYGSLVERKVHSAKVSLNISKFQIMPKSISFVA